MQDGRSTARKTVPKRMAGKFTLRLLTRDGEVLAKTTNVKVMNSTRT